MKWIVRKSVIAAVPIPMTVRRIDVLLRDNLDRETFTGSC